MDNLTFAIKLLHDDLPKFSDKEAFMKQFEQKRSKENCLGDDPDQEEYYPNTDLREKAMEKIKELDRQGGEKKVRFRRLREIFPDCFDEAVTSIENTVG